MLSAICFNFDQSKILSSGNGLRIDTQIYEPHFVKLELNAFAKDIDQCQPVQQKQADMG